MRAWNGRFVVAMGILACVGTSLVAQEKVPVKSDPKKAAVSSPAPASGLSEAVEAFNAQDFSRALKLLQAAYQADPTLPPPRIVMVEWFSQARLPGAIHVSLEAAAEETPNDPEAYILLAEAALNEGRLAEAALLLGHCKQLVDRYSSNADRKTTLENRVLSDKATLAEKRRKWEEMKQCLLALESRLPKSAQVQQRLGIAHFQLKEDEEARRRLEKAGALDATALPASAMMAQLYQLRGDTARVRTEIAAALKAKPKDTATLLIAAQLQLKNGEFDEAERNADKLLAVDAENPAILKLQGTIALFCNAPKKAEEHFQKVVVQSPNDFEASDGLALALSDQEDKPDALRRAVEYARANLQRNPNNPQAVATMGWCLFRVGKIDAAANLLDRLAATGDISANAAYYLARVSLQKGKTPQAVSLLQAALKTTPNFTKRDEAQALLGQLK
jgi:tetratricopeptide (TPR) repeat protein